MLNLASPQPPKPRAGPGRPLAPCSRPLSGAALFPKLEALDFTGVSRAINYGFDRLRFISPVKAGSRVRLTHRITKVEEKAGGLAFTQECLLEIENEERPALSCEWIVLVFAR